MAIITLTSDWGLKDHYLAVVKGSVYMQIPEAKIVDISHLVPKYDIGQAAYILKNAYTYFPKGSIHIVGVNTVASLETPHVAIYADGHYFIGADNGIFQLILDKKPEKIIELEIIQDSDYFTFSTKDVFVKVACHIANGGSIDELGIPKANLTSKNPLKPYVDDNSITGMVIYNDCYENAIVNITEKKFRLSQKGRNFIIEVRRKEIRKLSNSYNDVLEGELLALFGSNGFLQIAMNRGKAQSLHGLHINEPIKITFF